MSKYLSRDQINAQMRLVTALLTEAADAQGMTIKGSDDVVRVVDTDGSIILSLYAPSWGRSTRFWVSGKFVPYQYKIVGRPRHLERTSFFRADGLQAAREAIPFIRRQTDAEMLRKRRDTALSNMRESHPYRGPDVHEIAKEYGSHVEVAALEAYVQGWRSTDATANAQMERQLRGVQANLSDNVWRELLMFSWNVDIQRAEATV